MLIKKASIGHGAGSTVTGTWHRALVMTPGPGTGHRALVPGTRPWRLCHWALVPGTVPLTRAGPCRRPCAP